VIDDPDIEQAVERIERQLEAVRDELEGVRAELAQIAVLLEVIADEARATRQVIERNRLI
jgi:multidrug resistance efflux pump